MRSPPDVRARQRLPRSPPAPSGSRPAGARAGRGGGCNFPFPTARARRAASAPRRAASRSAASEASRVPSRTNSTIDRPRFGGPGIVPPAPPRLRRSSSGSVSGRGLLRIRRDGSAAYGTTRRVVQRAGEPAAGDHPHGRELGPIDPSPRRGRPHRPATPAERADVPAMHPRTARHGTKPRSSTSAGCRGRWSHPVRRHRFLPRAGAHRRHLHGRCRGAACRSGSRAPSEVMGVDFSPRMSGLSHASTVAVGARPAGS